jgi:hypothetical protein
MKPLAAANDECVSVLAGIVDAIQDGIVVFDRDFTVLWANRWMEERYADRAPLAGKKCCGVFTDRTEPRSDCPYVALVDDDHWEQVDAYIQAHSQAHISHGVCPDCMKKYHPDLLGG